MLGRRGVSLGGISSGFSTRQSNRSNWRSINYTKRVMADKKSQLTRLQKASQEDIRDYVQSLSHKVNNPASQTVGHGPFERSISAIPTIRVDNFTTDQALYGCSLERALKTNAEVTKDVVAVAFDRMLVKIGVKHPWEDEQEAIEAVDEILHRDPTWTLEDVALMFRMAAKGKLAKVYDRVGEPWLEECIMAYANLKVDAMERRRERVKLHHEVEGLMAADPQLPVDRKRKPMTMAEFLGGGNYLTALDRAEMIERDKQRAIEAANKLKDETS